VSARTQGDMAFTWSDWQRGIEPWRFNLPSSMSEQPDELVHTVFDRTLVRAGETASMKHLLRVQTGGGFALPQERCACRRAAALRCRRSARTSSSLPMWAVARSTGSRWRGNARPRAG